MAFLWALVSILSITFRQALAQSISDVPQCAENAAFSSISSTGCQLTDIECICKDQSFINSLLPVVQNDCSPADLQKTIAFTESLCKTVDITITLPTPSPTTSSTGTPVALPTSSIVPHNQNYTASSAAARAPSSKSTSIKSTAPATASATPSSQRSASTRVPSRHYARYLWAGILMVMTLLPLF